MSLMQFLSNGGLSKMAYIILVNLITIGAMVIVAIQVLNNEPVNQTMLYLLLIGVGHGATIGGAISGSASQQANPPVVNVVPPSAPLEQPTAKFVKVAPTSPGATTGGPTA